MFAGIHSPTIVAELSLAEFAYAFSPLVEEVGADTVVIDVEGCELLFGSAYDLAKQIAKTGAKPKSGGGIGCSVNVALCGNPDAAIHAAKFCKGITFTAPGEELTTLGRLPVTCLQHSLAGIDEDAANEILKTLNLWGVRTFEEFANLPATGISERLGQAGLRLQELARGNSSRNLKLTPRPPVFENSIELEYPIAQLEPLSFIFARLLNQICASLHSYALATNAICVELKLDQAAVHELKLNLPYPMRDHKVFLKLLLLNIENNPPPSAVFAVAITCDPIKPRLLQSGLFIPLAPEPEKLELTLARLAKLLGPENFGSPELVDTHRPDGFRLNRFVLKEEKRRAGRRRTADSRQQTTKTGQVEIRNPKSKIAFRRFRPPLKALVQAEHGRPMEVSAWDKTRSVYGKVVDLAGPWRTTGDWWRTDNWARDEWDVAIEPGGPKSIGASRGSLQTLYRIYRELGSGAWFVEGVYD
jgi:protein ImuB